MNNAGIGVVGAFEATSMTTVREVGSAGFQQAVSFKPYLDRIQKILANQYLLTFQVKPAKNAGLKRIKMTTEVAGVEFASADNVWVPAGK